MASNITGTVYVVEDESFAREAMERALAGGGQEVTAFASGDEVIQSLKQKGCPDVLVTDIRMPGKDGMEVLRSFRAESPDMGIILVTAFGSVEDAVEAMRRGADDYMEKPVNIEELRLRVRKLIERKAMRRQIRNMQGRLDDKYGFSSIVGNSTPMRRLFETMRLAAPTNSTVLITGESGTGKELIANAIHQNSPRREGPFEPVNCAAIQASVLESEIFGHEKGAFTGAFARKMGKFELASGGSLFLDEIGETPLEFQVKLLRFLETKEFSRVGGVATIRVNARLIAATNVDLDKAVSDGRVRTDLYYRLKVVEVFVPPLRERTSDIPLLLDRFSKTLAMEHGAKPVSLADAAVEVLTRYRWPGNVRQLRNMVESLTVLKPGREIGPEDLPADIRGEVVHRGGIFQIGMTMAEMERNAILETLSFTGNNRKRAAETLGIGLRTLQRKLKEYGAPSRSDEPRDSSDDLA